MTIPRFTLRRQMFVVAVLGLILGGGASAYRRHENLLRLAKYHQARSYHFAVKQRTAPLEVDGKPSTEKARLTELGNYHFYLQFTYERAAKRFWLPVTLYPDISIRPLEEVAKLNRQMEDYFRTHR